ncbi:MAG: hypothetical protein IPN34_01600 [Planctomycetes bacterium]|nr:hypothetical protein [Planctomycetota bacterium]
MFRMIKWAVLGCIALAAVNAFTDGRLREKVELSLELLDRGEEPFSLQRQIASAKRHLERSDRDFAKLHQGLIAEREALAGLDSAIENLERRQREQLALTEVLQERLETQLASFRELSGTYSRAQVEEQSRAAWRAIELQEEQLGRQRELRAAQLEKVASLERAVSEHLERQHQARLEIVRSEARLAALRRDGSGKPLPGLKSDDLEKAERATKKVRQELQAFEDTLYLRGLIPSADEAPSGPEVEAFRREMEARYGAAPRQDG